MLKSLLWSAAGLLLVAAMPGTSRAVSCDHIDYVIDCGQTISMPIPSQTQVMTDYGGVGVLGYDAGEYLIEFYSPSVISDLEILHVSQETHAVFLMGPGLCNSDQTFGWSFNSPWILSQGSINPNLTYYLSVDAQLPVSLGEWIDITFVCDNQPYELCYAALDGDGDGLAGCLDPDCFQHWTCQTPENCINGVDDNSDGLVDCDDPLCFTFPLCTPDEICDDGIDNNNDGLVDCIDPDPHCIYIGACSETDCNNGIDDDLDSLIDCNDPDCPGFPCVEDCANGVDDDFDNYVDCADEDCFCEPACYGGELCDNGIDDDGDFAEDCLDCECYFDAACVGEVCDNKIDDDNDTLLDCLDPECWTHPSCVPSEAGDCHDNLDNDFDGFVDCDDPDCATSDPHCTGLCDVITALSCNQTYFWSSGTPQETDILFDYASCGLNDQQLHPESAFGLPALTGDNAHFDTIDVTVVPSYGTLNELVVLEAPGGGDCSRDLDCVDHVEQNTMLTFEPTAGASHYAIVESNGYAADFEVVVACRSQVEDCASPGEDSDADGALPCDDSDCDGYAFPDADGDGHDVCDDCYDGDAAVHPGADEVPCDGIDQDCDGADIGSLDEDGDGYVLDTCPDGDDCDDGNADIHPGADEVCDDGVDNDCDGDVDGDDGECAGDDDTTSDDDDDDTTSDDDTGMGDDDTCNGGCCCDIRGPRSTRTAAGLQMIILVALLGSAARRRLSSRRSAR